MGSNMVPMVRTKESMDEADNQSEPPFRIARSFKNQDVAPDFETSAAERQSPITA